MSNAISQLFSSWKSKIVLLSLSPSLFSYIFFILSLLWTEARFQLPLRIIAVLLFCMCLYCHPLLVLFSHHVCCCHCWFMRQLWGRISLLSPTTKPRVRIWLLFLIVHTFLSIGIWNPCGFQFMKNKKDGIETKTILSIGTWCNIQL